MATVPQNLFPEDAQFLAANFPAFSRLLGTNFPVSVLAYDAATKETAFFKLEAVRYGSGNLTLVIRWLGDTATSGDVIWGAQIAAYTPDTDTGDITTKAFATANTVTDTHLGTTAKREMTCTITISNLDSIAANDTFWLALYRDAAAGGDTMTGDALFVEARLEYSDT
jgi:hypothetical protein